MRGCSANLEEEELYVATAIPSYGGVQLVDGCAPAILGTELIQHLYSKLYSAGL